MISYRAPEKISYESEQKFLKVSNQFNRTDSYGWADNRNDSFIRIKDSVFENLAYQQVITGLSNLEKNTVSCSTEIASFFNCVFKPHDHRGFILNTKGFPGSIQIQGSTI